MNAYKGLLSEKQEEVSTAKSRYENGLEKLLFTESQVRSPDSQATAKCACGSLVRLRSVLALKSTNQAHLLNASAHSDVCQW